MTAQPPPLKRVRRARARAERAGFERAGLERAGLGFRSGLERGRLELEPRYILCELVVFLILDTRYLLRQTKHHNRKRKNT